MGKAKKRQKVTYSVTDIELDVPELNFDEWDEMHTRLFDRQLAALGEIDDDAVLSMTANVPRTEHGFLLRSDTDGKLALDWDGFLGTAPVRDAERQWKRIARAAKRGAACYFGVAPRRSKTLGQGGKADVVAHTHLVADIDWAEGEHQSSSNPPRKVLERWIADLPVMPGLIVNSGGGYHLYLTLEEPIDVQRSARGRALYAGWRQWWIDRAKQDGFTIDISPLTNEALVLRVAGTPAPKYQRTLVRIERSIPTTDDDHAIDDLLEVFPAPPEPERKARRTTGGVSARGGDKSAVLAGGSLKDFSPGDLFAVEGDLHRIAIDLLGLDYAGRDGDANALLAPWTDRETVAPEYPEGKNAGLFIHYDGTPLLKIWGQGVREDWAHFSGTTPDETSDGDVYNAFYALAQCVARLGADAATSWTLAARLVVHYRTIDRKGFADFGSLYDDLAAAESVEEVAALVPERPARKVRFHDDATEAPAPAAAKAALPALWAPDAYETRSERLSAARVAPLVAAARGYCTLSDADAAKAALTRIRQDRRSRVSRAVLEMSDALFVPQYETELVVQEARRNERQPDESVREWGTRMAADTQLEPTTATFQDERQNVSATRVLDLHPSTPDSWLDAAAILVDGTIAADALLTEMLLHGGVSEERMSESPTPAIARARLTTLMASVDPEDRMFVASVDLRGKLNDVPMIALSDRTVYLLPEGDVDGDYAANVAARRRLPFSVRLLGSSVAGEAPGDSSWLEWVESHVRRMPKALPVPHENTDVPSRGARWIETTDAPVTRARATFH